MNTYVSKAIIVIGLCSYSFYLIHQPYLKNLLDLLGSISGNNMFRILNVLPAFIITFLISYLLYRLVELPSIQLGARLRKTKNI
jgi:peptidoglycan/LPS O-acetylase OafA/YrhL